MPTLVQPNGNFGSVLASAAGGLQDSFADSTQNVGKSSLTSTKPKRSGLYPDWFIALFFAIICTVALIAIGLGGLWQLFSSLMLWRPSSNESHVLSLVAVVGLMVWAARAKSPKYGVMLGAFTIWGHELVWWTVYTAVYLPGLWFPWIQSGVGFYMTLRIYPALLRQGGYAINWKRAIYATAPYLVYVLGWLAVGFPSSVTFSEAGSTTLLTGAPSALFLNVAVNAWENFSWLVIVAGMWLSARDDESYGLPFVLPSQPKPERRLEDWKVFGIAVAAAVLLTLWGHVASSLPQLGSVLYVFFGFALLYFFVFALPKPVKKLK